MKKIIKLVLIIAALAGMTGMVSCANGSSDDSSSEISATKAKKTTTVKIGDTEYVYTTTDDKVDTSDKVTVADDGSVTVKADDGSKVTISKDGKTITYTDKNGKEYTGAFAEETTLKNSDGSEVKATTKSKSETVSGDAASVNIELPASVGVNELAGKTGQVDSDIWNFEDNICSKKISLVVPSSAGGGMRYERTDSYRYTYDSTKKLIYLAKKSITETRDGKAITCTRGEDYKKLNKKVTEVYYEQEVQNFNTMHVYKYSVGDNNSIVLDRKEVFIGKMPSYASFHGDGVSLGGWISSNNSFCFATFTDGTSGTFSGPCFSGDMGSGSEKKEGTLSGTYSLEGNTNISPYPYLVHSIYVDENGIYPPWYSQSTDVKISWKDGDNSTQYIVYTNNAGNTFVTREYSYGETKPDERTYIVTCAEGTYTLGYNKTTKKLNVTHIDGSLKTYENIEKVCINKNFSSYFFIEYLPNSYNLKSYNFYSGMNGKEDVCVPYKLKLTFTSVPSGVTLTANQTYTLYLSEY